MKNSQQTQLKLSWFQLFCVQTFRFFASLKLAIFLLLTLIVVLSTGTILESLYGMDASRLVVYSSPWFTVLLVMLGMNVAAAALDRLPWQKKHTGFVLTHAGIIMILTGSLISQEFMIDATMAIEEGKQEYRITLPQPLLYFYSGESESDWLVDLPKKPFVWKGETLVAKADSHEGWSLFMTDYLPKARMQESWVAAEEGPAAVELEIKNSFMNQSMWLIENDEQAGSVQMGPATFSFKGQPLQAAESPAEMPFGYIEASAADQKYFFALPETLEPGMILEEAGAPFQLRVLKTYQYAVVENNVLVEKEGPEDGPVNPAIQLTIENEKHHEMHTVFAKFPEFPTIHGKDAGLFGVTLQYRLPGGGSGKESHELRFMKTEKGLEHFIQNGPAIQQGQADVGESYNTGWMDIAFTVKKYLPHARKERSYVAVDYHETGQNILTAIGVELHSKGETKKIWLGQGVRESLVWNGNEYVLLFGQKRHPLNFRLFLKDFRIEHYPGTRDPASFESDVVLIDEARGVEKEATISMNEPLVYEGYRIYQSGYSLDDPTAEVSIFSIGKDPGIPLKYLGTIVMTIGILLIFFTKKFSTSKGRVAS